MERNDKRRDIRSLGLKELEAAAQELGEPMFRGKQMHEWIWKHSVTSFEAMTNLSNAFRQKLQEHYEFRPLTIDAQQQSADGTVKCRFKLFDGNVVEGVLIPSTERAEDRLSDRMTACLSSQVGCSLNCSFCATGFMDLKRNLEPAEIYDQVVVLNRISQEVHGSPLTNIVFMGMGEPLLNYRNVLAAIERITAPDGLNISAKRITVSTAGIAKMIKRLGDDEVRFNLALSLHHTHDEARSKIMPINESNSLDALVDALNYFYDKTGGRITSVCLSTPSLYPLLHPVILQQPLFFPAQKSKLSPTQRL